MFILLYDGDVLDVTYIYIHVNSMYLYSVAELEHLIHLIWYIKTNHIELQKVLL